MRVCKCGCGQEANCESGYRRGHWTRAGSTRKKLSRSAKLFYESEKGESRKRNLVEDNPMRRPDVVARCLEHGSGRAFLGRHHSEETKRKKSLVAKQNHLLGVYDDVIPYRAIRYNGRWYKSQPEVDVQACLDDLGIVSRYEPKRFELGDDVIYTPDFYLSEYDVWIEVKGYMDDEDEQKIVRFGLEYELYLLWGGNDEILEQLSEVIESLSE
jgi:hypothetical protein